MYRRGAKGRGISVLRQLEIPPFAQNHPSRGLLSFGLHRKFLSHAYTTVNFARMVCLCAVDCLRFILMVDPSGTGK